MSQETNSHLMIAHDVNYSGFLHSLVIKTKFFISAVQHLSHTINWWGINWSWIINVSVGVDSTFFTKIIKVIFDLFDVIRIRWCGKCSNASPWFPQWRVSRLSIISMFVGIPKFNDSSIVLFENASIAVIHLPEAHSFSPFGSSPSQWKYFGRYFFCEYQMCRSFVLPIYVYVIFIFSNEIEYYTFSSFLYLHVLTPLLG